MVKWQAHRTTIVYLQSSVGRPCDVSASYSSDLTTYRHWLSALHIIKKNSPWFCRRVHSEEACAASLDGISLLPRIIPSCSFGSFHADLHTMIRIFLTYPAVSCVLTQGRRIHYTVYKSKFSIMRDLNICCPRIHVYYLCGLESWHQLHLEIWI